MCHNLTTPTCHEGATIFKKKYHNTQILLDLILDNKEEVNASIKVNQYLQYQKNVRFNFIKKVWQNVQCISFLNQQAEKAKQLAYSDEDRIQEKKKTQHGRL